MRLWGHCLLRTEGVGDSRSGRKDQGVFAGACLAGAFDSAAVLMIAHSATSASEAIRTGRR